jgi:O-acetyl-ADP-ribose deacetylase (regulator of RNase III)
MERTIGTIQIETILGDIADQPDMDAVVNAANAELRMGGGVAKAIHRKAGPGLAEETRPLAPIEPGQAVMTSGHDLPNDHVIHCLGPVYGRDEPADELLAACFRNALRLAEQNGLASIAFPAISTGAFGYPTDDAAAVAVDAVVSMAEELSSIERVRFVLYSESDARTFEAALRARTSGA